jgi:hypothetical protein
LGEADSTCSGGRAGDEGLSGESRVHHITPT